MSFDSAAIDGPDGVHHCPKTILNLVQAEKQGIIISERFERVLSDFIKQNGSPKPLCADNSTWSTGLQSEKPAGQGGCGTTQTVKGKQ